jgi:alkanesulfonate monooxygenase SsuD/methylene tetrahydromethanopterin reductase-like flavin-dependent oxidoreductase (luciferase family)
VPRSAQGHPVIIQAGQSGRGRQFAGRWGEVIFTTSPNVSFGKRSYTSLKDEAARAGRDPEGMLLCNLVTPVCAETRAEAEDKMALIQQLPLEIDQLSLLAEALNFDFATKDLDDQLTDEELASFSGIQTIRDRVIGLSGKHNPTVREFMHLSHRGRPDDAIVGGPREVADRLEELFTERVCDGFVVGATYVPGGYADFVEYVVPELQRRGLFHQDYTGATLRENLGLARPAPGAWRGVTPRDERRAQTDPAAAR